MIKRIHINQKNFNSYLTKNFSSDQKILISLSCGLDSTALFYLINKSNFFKKKNIYCVFFDHKKRPEGKFEIQKFIRFYNIANSQFFIKKIDLKQSKKSFQNLSRIERHKLIKLIATKNKIKNIFLGHHLDDIYETFFLRELQQSNILGLLSIFSNTIDGLSYFRPLTIYSKKQIFQFAIKNKIIWSEDRTNIELDYTRNKIRNFLANRQNIQNIILKRNAYLNFKNLVPLQSKYFEKLSNKKYKINYKSFNMLNGTLKLFIIQSFYYNLRHSMDKNIRKDNCINLIKLLKNKVNFNKERSVFGGKITIYNDNILLNLN